MVQYNNQSISSIVFMGLSLIVLSFHTSPSMYLLRGIFCTIFSITFIYFFKKPCLDDNPCGTIVDLFRTERRWLWLTHVKEGRGPQCRSRWHQARSPALPSRCWFSLNQTGTPSLHMWHKVFWETLKVSKTLISSLDRIILPHFRSYILESLFSFTFLQVHL